MTEDPVGSEREFATHDEFVQELFEFEVEHDLFETTVNDVRFWEWLRIYVTQTVATGVGVTPDSDTTVERSVHSYLRGLLDLAKYSVYRNPLFGPETDVLFFAHPRRKLWKNDRWWDIYSDPIKNRLDQRSLTVEHPNQLDHRTPAETDDLYYLDSVQYAPQILDVLGLGTPSLSAADRAELDRLDDAFETEFGVSVDLTERVRQMLLNRRVERYLYGKMLDRLDPELVVLVCSYGQETFIEVCSDRSIPVVELQHGVIYPEHTGYAFPGERDKQTFPDYFFAFGDFWRDVVEYPIEDDRVLSIGYPYFEEAAAAYEDVTSREQVVIVSQPGVGERLAHFATELSQSPSFDYEVVFKPHPKHGEQWRSKYPWLTDTTVEVADPGGKHLYELFAESSVQIGVSSTALYEGLYFDLDTYVVNTPHKSMVRSLLALDDVHIVDDVEEFTDEFSPTADHIDTEQFFKSDSLERANKELERLLSEATLSG